MKIICGLDRLSFFLSRMPWLRNLWIDAATAFAAQLLGDSLKTVHWTVFACKAGHSLPFYILFLLKINKRTVPALTCPYNYRHRMMTILFLLQAWHGYRWNSSRRKSDFSGLPWPTICVWFRTLFLESFSELRFRLCFLFWTETSFFSKKEDCLKKTALSDYFLRILIDKLGPYMCYVINI